MPPAEQQEIVTFSEVLQKVGKPDFRRLASDAADRIRAFHPNSIVCHDYAVPYVLLALVRLKKKSLSPNACLTVFNGAFRKFDVFKAPHPFRSQYTGWEGVVRDVTEHGGEVDPVFRELNPLVRALYRRVILFSVKEKVTALFRASPPLHLDLGIPAQVIASANDSYIPFETVQALAEDFDIKVFHKLNYGHFPYSGNGEEIRRLISEFEAQIH